MKRFIAILCFTALLCGCGDIEETSDKKISSSELVTETTAPTTAEVTTEPEEQEVTWQAAYREIIEESRSEAGEYGLFGIYDLDSDGVPELSISGGTGDSAFTRIYTVSSGETVKIAEYTTENPMLIAETGVIRVDGYDQEKRCAWTEFCCMKNNELVLERRFERIFSDSDDDKLLCDGKEVTEDEFNAAIRQYESGLYTNLGGDFRITDELIAAVLGEEMDWKSAYSAYLTDVLQTVNEEDGAGFSVLDINGDGVPELFRSEGMYHVSGVDILTYNGGLRHLGYFGSYGNVSYYPDTNELLSSNMGMGYLSGTFMTLNGDDFISTLSYSDDSGAIDPESGEEPEYIINGQKVTMEKYIEATGSHSEYDFCVLGTDNELTMENIEALAKGQYKAPTMYSETVPDPSPLSENYRNILEKFYNSCILEHTGIEITGSEYMSDNTFAVYDVDKDGRDELIINVTSTFTAEMVTVIYGETSEGDVLVKLISSPDLTYYDNGVIEAGVMHNQGLAGRFWPYTIYTYDSEDAEYKFYKYIDAWDKEVYPDGFPAEADTSGTGIVYYINADYSDSNVDPMDVTEYEKWHSDFMAGAKPVELPYLNITEDNIY